MAGGVEIHDRAKDGAQLLEILGQVGPRAPELTWTFLYLEAYGDLPQTESERIGQEINDAPDGLILKWEDIASFIRPFSAIFWAVLFGCVEGSDIPHVGDGDLDLIPKWLELYRAGEVVIERVDAYYWHVYAKDDEVLNRIRDHFKDVRPCGRLDREPLAAAKPVAAPVGRAPRIARLLLSARPLGTTAGYVKLVRASRPAL